MNTDEKIGHAYTLSHYAAFADLELLDAICRIETLGDRMPSAMLQAFRAEAEKRGLVGTIDLAPAPARTVTRKEYNSARALLKHNGRHVLRWMPERIAQVFRALFAQPADNLAEKADFLAGYAKEGKTGTYGAQWTAYARRGAK